MKIILVLLASALTLAQASRLGLLRVDPYGPTKGKLASAEFDYTRTLQEEDAFNALRELMAMSMPMTLSMPMGMSMPMAMSMPYSESLSGPSAGTVTSTPVSTPTPTVIDSPGTTAPQVTPSGTVAPSPSPSLPPQVAPTGTVAPTNSVTFAPSPTSAPTGVDLGLPTPGLSSANQAENSGGTSGPDTHQTILFVVAAFAAVAVGAALMARKFSAGSGTSSTNGSVVSVPSQEPAADGRLVDEEL